MFFKEKEADSTASSSTVNVTGAKAKRSQSLFIGQSGQMEKGQVFAFGSSRYKQDRVTSSLKAEGDETSP